MWSVSMNSLPNFVCQCQRAFSAIDSCFRLLTPVSMDPAMVLSWCLRNLLQTGLVWRMVIHKTRLQHYLKPQYNLQIEGQPRLFPDPVSTPESQAVLCRYAVKVCRIIWLMVLYPDNPEQSPYGLWSHRAHRKLAVSALHHQAHLCWCRQHMQQNLNMWRKVMFSDDRVKGSPCFSIGSALPDRRELHTAHVPVQSMQCVQPVLKTMKSVHCSCCLCFSCCIYDLFHASPGLSEVSSPSLSGFSQFVNQSAFSLCTAQLHAAGVSEVCTGLLAECFSLQQNIQTNGHNHIT